MNAIPLINNIPKTNINNEKQLRQEINTSLVALKKEAGTLEGLINEAAQMLVTINNRIATLENDTVKKSDVVDVVQSGNLQPVTSNAVSGAISALDVSSVGGSGKYISAISETDGKINATASNLATSIESGNTAPVTSEVVDSMRKGMLFDTTLFTLNDNETKTVTLSSARMYLFVNIHAVNGQELIILNCYNGVLRQTRITHAKDGNDTVITNSGQNVTFKATTGCRGHLLFLTQYYAT